MKNIVLSSCLLLLLVNNAISQYAETRTLSEFTAIEVGGNFDVELIPSNNHSVKIIDSNVKLDDLFTNVKGNTLKISFDWKSKPRSNKKAQLQIYYVQLDGISGSASADITSIDPLVSSQLDIDASSGAEIKLIIDVNNLDIDMSSGSELELSGHCTDQKIDMSSGATYSGRKLKSNNSDVDVSSGASAKISVSESLDAEASSGGSVRYQGSPAKLREDKSSGGSVRSL